MLFCFPTFPHVFVVSYHLAHYFAPSHFVCLIALPAMSGPMDVTTTAPETTVPAQEIGTTTPDRVSTPPNQPSTADASSMVSVAPPPPEAYNALNYHFNHQLPTNAPFYRPGDILNHLTTVEYDSIHTPTVDQGRNYAEVYVGLTLEEYQLLSQQQTTPMPDLDYQLPIHNLPSDLRARFTTTQPTLFRSVQLLLLPLDFTTSHRIAHQLHGHCSTSSPSRNFATLHQQRPPHQLFSWLLESHGVSHWPTSPTHSATTSTTSQDQLRHEPDHLDLQVETTSGCIS